MAVTFTSYGYDTTTGNPYTEIAWADAHPEVGSSQYGVRGASDWKVSAVSGADRTVSIAAGFGWGYGVIDETLTNDTIQLDTIASGSRWDLIAVRRDWTPTAGVSQFVKVNGGSTQAIPGGRLADRGAIDDQPIALVQVTAGQTQPTAIIDLRCWATNGGLVAKDALAKSYLNQLGTEVFISGSTWRYVPGANDVPEWVSDTVAVYAPLAVNAFTTSGTVTVEKVGNRTQVNVNVRVTRSSATALAVGTSFINLGVILPPEARGGATGNELYLALGMVGGGMSELAYGSVHPVTGQFYVQAETAFSWPQYGLATFNCQYLL